MIPLLPSSKIHSAETFGRGERKPAKMGRLVAKQLLWRSVRQGEKLKAF